MDRQGDPRRRDAAPSSGPVAVQVEHVHGDLLEQVGQVDALVNPWNRNFIPRWLLLPQGVSGALKRRTGPEPWRQLRQRGLLELGEAVVTSGGRLPVPLIHVAGLTMTWRATPASVRASIFSALSAAVGNGWQRIAMPLIGASTGGLSPQQSLEVIERAITDWVPDPPAPLGTALPFLMVRIVTLATLDSSR